MCSQLLVCSCCEKSETTCYHIVTRLMMVTDVVQVVPTLRLTQPVCNKLLACCHQHVNSVLSADGTTCSECVSIINLATTI